MVQDIDLIILGGYYGEGKYTGIINSFMMGVAVATKNENPSQFLSLVSVSSGLGNQMLRDLQTKLATYWIKECPESIKGRVKVNILTIILLLKVFLLFFSKYFNAYIHLMHFKIKYSIFFLRHSLSLSLQRHFVITRILFYGSDIIVFFVGESAECMDSSKTFCYFNDTSNRNDTQ